ncbi:multidrug effflux MFS transporter [Sphingobacterium sp. LRF_L2]|uniref:multidrug effflux MFS transporter n=1 Tax=Sphingobacterium sp. LRF_L2 TaxID=3369421 RepID=UPI003F608C8A
MKYLNKKQIIIVLILAFLTALEPLSIDLFLPAFVQIADYFQTTEAQVQLSLSTFLGGFAIGQLIWGPLADRYGRKKPLIISLLIFTIASLGCVYVHSIEQLWTMRFIQAIGGCGGIVIARAVVTDYFGKSQTLSIFAILALIMGVAPIIAPIIGNQLIKIGGWEFTFEAMTIFGVIGILASLFYLPETLVKKNAMQSERKNVVVNYLAVLKNRQFLIYTLIAGVLNGALMIYIGNAPFLIMKKAGLSGDIFSVIFALNALGMMFSAYLTSALQKKFASKKIVSFASAMMCVFAFIFIILSEAGLSIPILLVVLFFYIFPMGILFPTTTDIAMTPFSGNSSGSASSLFGSIQLGIAFLMTMFFGKLSDGTVFGIGLAFLLSALVIIPLLITKNTSNV